MTSLPKATRSARPLRVAEARVYPLGGDALVYVPRTETAHALNGSALAIFERCDGDRTVADIGRELAEAIGRDVQTLLPDVEHGIAQLEQFGLITYQ